MSTKHHQNKRKIALKRLKAKMAKDGYELKSLRKNTVVFRNINNNDKIRLELKVDE